MFDEKDYKAVFSHVTASRETHRRILNMADQKYKRRGMRMFTKVLVAAVMISLLSVTVAASELGWFAKYFADEREEPMSTEQISYIEENEQHFNQSVTCDGFTMELKSAITDGEKAYICIGITGPESILLNKTDIEGYSTQKPTLLAENWSTNFLTDRNGEPFFGASRIASVEDYDGLDNTQNLVVELTADDAVMGKEAFGAAKEWTLKFENLIAKYDDLAYINQLTEGKYKGKQDYFFTTEENMRLHPEVVLAEGVWEFKFCFAQPDVRGAELIQVPVETKIGIGMNAQGEYIYDTVNVTSFVIRTLSATVCTDNDSYAPDFTAADDIYVVMLDGSQVRLESESAGSGEQQLRAEVPVLVENVDYVLLADGTKLPMLE